MLSNKSSQQVVDMTFSLFFSGLGLFQLLSEHGRPSSWPFIMISCGIILGIKANQEN